MYQAFCPLSFQRVKGFTVQEGELGDEDNQTLCQVNVRKGLETRLV
jgi:hypothetical protein